MSKFKEGDLVTIRTDAGTPNRLLGVVFKVKKVNPRNILAYPVVPSATAGGKGINYPAELLEPFAGEVPENGRLSGVTVPLPQFFDVGEIVTFMRPPAGSTVDTPYVVVKDSGDDKINVSKLGGEGSRYYRAAKIGIVKRDLAWLKEHL